jgi:adenylosuccinate synthase
VGLGPFPSELKNEQGERIRSKGGEFGSTTGRPRRVGWINLDELARATKLSDCSVIALTKGDVLCGEKNIGVWSAGKLEIIPGWETLTNEGGTLDANFERLLSMIETKTGISVAAVGSGSDRHDIIWRKPISNYWT